MLINSNTKYTLSVEEGNNSYTNYKQLFILLVVWLAIGISLGLLSIPILLLLSLYLQNKGLYLYLFIIFFFTIILSDSRIYALSFSQDLKIFLMLLLLVPFLFPQRISLKLDFAKSLYQPFIVYIAFSLFCLIFSPVVITGFQKTFSYFLLLLIIPIIFYSLYDHHRTFLFKALIYLGALILVSGYIMYFVNPAWVMYNNGGRTSGALGNPNGLGIFCFIFYIFYFAIKHYFPTITSKREHIIVYMLIFSSLLWSGSRGQTMAVLVFMITQHLSRRNKTVGLLLSSAIGIALVTIEVDIVAIAQTLGFEDYLRVDTLDKAGGRVVAREFAWEHINKNFWIGRGFSYTEWIYGQHFRELSMRGHEGNAHNAFLTVWLDTGLIGLMLFIFGWGTLFLRAAKNSYLAFPILFAIVASNMVESWLAASLNPYTIQLLMVLTLLIYIVKDQDKAQVSVHPLTPPVPKKIK